MVRIRIDQLPPEESLSPEELLALYGAGLRLEVESLEGRELMTGGLTALLTPPPNLGAFPGARFRQADTLQIVQGAIAGTAYALDAEGDLHRFSDVTGWREVSDDKGPLGKSLAVGRDAVNKADQVFLQAADDSVFRFKDGMWEATGRTLKALAAGQGKLFGLDTQNKLVVYDVAAKRWTDTNGFGKSLVLGKDAAGKDEVYVQAVTDVVWRYTAAGRWENTGMSMASIQAGRDEVFGLDTRGQMWAYSRASKWRNLNMVAKDFVVGKLSTGQDMLFARKDDGGVFQFDVGKWTDLKRKLTGMVAAQGQLFGTDAQDKVWAYDAATRKWTDTGKSGVALTLGTDARGKNELYLRDAAGRLWDYEGGKWKEITPEAAKGKAPAASPQMDKRVHRDENGRPYMNPWGGTGAYFLWVNESGNEVSPQTPGMWTTAKDKTSGGVHFYYTFHRQNDGTQVWEMWGRLARPPVLVPQDPPPQSPGGGQVQAPANPQTESAVTTSPGGATNQVFKETKPDNTDCIYVRPGRGGVFGAPILVTDPGRQCSTPVVAGNDRGDLAVLWVELNVTWSVRLRVWSSQTQTWSAVIGVSDLGAHGWDPSVAMDEHGNVVIAYNVWVSEGNWDVYARRFDVRGQLTHTIAVAIGTMHQHHAQVVCGPGGRFAIAHGVETTGWWNVMVRMFDANCTNVWSGWIDDGAGYFSGPSLAFDSDGWLLVAYKQWNNGSWDVCTKYFGVDGRRYDNAVMLIHQNVGTLVGNTCLAMGRDGNYVVGYTNLAAHVSFVVPVWGWTTITTWQDYSSVGSISLSVDVTFTYYFSWSQVVDGVSRVYLETRTPGR